MSKSNIDSYILQTNMINETKTFPQSESINSIYIHVCIIVWQLAKKTFFVEISKIPIPKIRIADLHYYLLSNQC